MTPKKGLSWAQMASSIVEHRTSKIQRSRRPISWLTRPNAWPLAAGRYVTCPDRGRSTLDQFRSLAWPGRRADQRRGVLGPG